MKIIKTEGIVIKKIDFGESDRIIKVVSKNLGKISIFIKGIRKSKKREGFASDIINYSEFIVNERENSSLYSCNSFELKYPFMRIRSNMTTVNIALYLAKFLDAYLEEREKNEKLFRLYVNTMKYMEKEENTIKIFISIAYFLLNIIKDDGVMFLIDEGNYFNLEESCIGAVKTEDKTVKLSEMQKKIIYFMNKVDIQAIYELKLKENDILTIIAILEMYIEIHLNIKIKIKKFLKEDI